MRSMSGEDEGCLPVIDLYGYEHVVYILDSLIYTLTNWPKTATPTLPSPPPTTSDNPVAATLNFSEETDDAVMADDEDETPASQDAREKQKSARFFERSESITVAEEEVQKSNELFFGTPGSPGGQSSGPLQEAFPLAKQPHLLRSNAKKEQLFSNPRQPLLEVGGDKAGESSVSLEERRGLPVSYSHLQQHRQQEPIMLSWPVEKALQRWNTVIGVFAHIFLAEGPGSERSNFLNARAGFASRMSRFRHQISQLFDSNQSMRGDWASVSNTLSIRVRRDRLLEDSLDYLSNLSRFHYSQIRVKFEGEDGSGPGVNRGFFASLANALKNTDSTKHPCNKLGLLFYQPGKEPEQSGLYAPLPFKYPSSNSATKNNALRTQRLNMYKAIGRFLGLCFWFRHTIPFTVCRHVAKFLIGRELAWHDLAFFNAELYEGFRRMMLDAELGRMNKDEFQQVYCCYFEAPLSGQTSEPVFVDLVHDGSKIPVTPDRVQEYVRLYSMFVMVEGVKDELQAMRDGLISVIPPEILEGLTAEDFQLLLAGDSANISLSRLKSVIKFNHTHGRPSHICERFEKMFWQVVGHMSNAQRQQLLYFATGSAALPASSDNEPSISITIDVIGGSNSDSLPVASTCSQRMSIPLYPSYHTLKKKLLQAVQCQAYGLG